MNIDWFRLIVSCIPLISALISVFLIPWLNAKLGTEKMNQYRDWAYDAVRYAEMVFSGDEGQKKKEYCMQFLTEIINKKREILTEEQISVLIESVVQELKLAEKAVE